MLEKIGLPAKPSQRGNNWVVDASHCQRCSSQFTFINRKHHCRRCGGLFCNSCTQHRMLLRGQGDYPVRICDPCKQLEEAARFERRYGQKSRAGKGNSKQTSENEDDLLNQILGNPGNDSLSSKRESTNIMTSNILRATSSSSSSSMQETSIYNEGDDLIRSLSSNIPSTSREMGSTTPEELRQQALDEKKKHRTLKAEGKPAEALQAFKRGKELERQAVALEISIRKSRRKIPSSSDVTEGQKFKDDNKESDIRINRVSDTSKGKDDLAAELRELGWSDMDLHEADKRPTNVTVEGELSTLIGELSQSSNTKKGSSGIDRSEVTAIKKRALALKREGKLAEAKEELKRAKILEKQLEEQEFLIEAEDSDDELSLLIRSMDNDKQNDLLNGPEAGFDLDHVMDLSDNLGVDGNFDVTDADFNDPDIAAALKSFGWAEEFDELENIVNHSSVNDRNMLLSQIQSLKREALSSKRAGNTLEAMELLKKAKLIERDLDRHPQVSNMDLSETSEEQFKPSEAIEVVIKKPPLKSKIMIQRELLGLKKNALTLRRQGKLDEAEEELKRAKVLEKELDEMGNASHGKAAQLHVSNKHPDISSAMDLEDKGEEEDVTDKDMNDPTYLSLLSNLGWKDEDVERKNFPSKPSSQNESHPLSATDVPSSSATSSIRTGVSRSNGEIQRELLGLKRKALALRRQGQVEEADEVLRKSKELEQIAELESPKKDVSFEADKQKEMDSIKSPIEIDADVRKNNDVAQESHPTRSFEKNQELEKQKPDIGSSVVTYSTNVSTIVEKQHTSSDIAPKPLSGRERFKLQQQSLSHKRQSLKLRREGRTEEADAEFQLAKALETQLEESSSHDSLKSNSGGTNPADDASVEGLLDPQLLSALRSVGFEDVTATSQSVEKHEPSNISVNKSESSRQERIQLEEQIKAEKVKAVTLKRAGNKTEALNALRQAKILEKKLNSLP